MRKLFYVPLESYPERYTHQLSRPEDGWMESNFRKHGVPYLRINGARLTRRITDGVVLDACGRGFYACVQMQELLYGINAGEVTSDDVIYFEDFWTPGMEAIPYACTLKGIKPKMFAFCWAQSWDEYDFTTKMMPWIRHIERGTALFLDGIFVTSTLLKEKILSDFSSNVPTVHVVGLPFCSEEVLSYCKPAEKKRNQVVYSSRLDKEKDPLFFLQVARDVLKTECWLDDANRIKFVVTTSFSELRSNDPAVVPEFRKLAEEYPDHFIIMENLTKAEYYAVLNESKVQFNCALQDWVSWTLLEATAYGCHPLYPAFRSFPETLRQQRNLMYTKPVDWSRNHVVDCSAKLKEIMQNDYARDEFDWIYKPFDDSCARMIAVMKGRPFQPLF